MAPFRQSLALYLSLIKFFLVEFALSQQGAYPKSGEDLATFVSRPDLVAPTFNITVYDSASVASGYWFMAPYTNLKTELSRMFRPAQIGPQIFDNQGNLVWSGATFSERTTCDFNVGFWNDSHHLSYILVGDPDLEPEGVGYIMDSSYTIQQEVHAANDTKFGMHEFNIINQGRSALIITGQPRWIEGHDGVHINAWECTAQEIDIETGESIFSWNSLDYVPLSESYHELPNPEEMKDVAWLYWDYLHMNSVDKNDEGDYLISGRYSNCIYKVSGQDGSVIWRLGGKRSSFVLEDFNFSGQHNARFLSENSTTTVISFLNNASDQVYTTGNYSSVMIVALYYTTTPMTATIVKQFDRPDNQLTALRGNVQVLPNSNIFAGWSENGYVSEFTPDGRIVFEAQWASKRYATYRAYKFDFIGLPTESPALKSYAYGAQDTAVTACWVSWNGATEVSSWNFYGPNKDSLPGITLLGSAERTGFETMFTVASYSSWVIAEAVAADGSILGQSDKIDTIVPGGITLSGNTQGKGPSDTKSLPGAKGNNAYFSVSNPTYNYRIQKSFFSSWINDIIAIITLIAFSLWVYYIGFSILWTRIYTLKIYKQKYILLNN